ncbi:MAG: hypothetical protein KC492_23925, partial [Myxococcales bacterium]|nr:hypothetical protein [Myxococcales bacterium]
MNRELLQQLFELFSRTTQGEFDTVSFFIEERFGAGEPGLHGSLFDAIQEMDRAQCPCTPQLLNTGTFVEEDDLQGRVGRMDIGMVFALRQLGQAVPFWGRVEVWSREALGIPNDEDLSPVCVLLPSSWTIDLASRQQWRRAFEVGCRFAGVDPLRHIALIYPVNPPGTPQEAGVCQQLSPLVGSEWTGVGSLSHSIALGVYGALRGEQPLDRLQYFTGLVDAQGQVGWVGDICIKAGVSAPLVIPGERAMPDAWREYEARQRRAADANQTIDDIPPDEHVERARCLLGDQLRRHEHLFESIALLGWTLPLADYLDELREQFATSRDVIDLKPLSQTRALVDDASEEVDPRWLPIHLTQGFFDDQGLRQTEALPEGFELAAQVCAAHNQSRLSWLAAEPNQGKTTLLRRLAYTLASHPPEPLRPVLHLEATALHNALAQRGAQDDPQARMDQALVEAALVTWPAPSRDRWRETFEMVGLSKAIVLIDRWDNLPRSQRDDLFSQLSSWAQLQSARVWVAARHVTLPAEVRQWVELDEVPPAEALAYIQRLEEKELAPDGLGARMEGWLSDGEAASGPLSNRMMLRLFATTSE